MATAVAGVVGAGPVRPDGWTGRTGPEDLELRLRTPARATGPMQSVTSLSSFESVYVGALR